MEDILGSIDGIRHSQEKLRGCIAQSELPFSPLQQNLWAEFGSGNLPSM